VHYAEPISAGNYGGFEYAGKDISEPGSMSGAGQYSGVLWRLRITAAEGAAMIRCWLMHQPWPGPALWCPWHGAYHLGLAGHAGRFYHD